MLHKKIKTHTPGKGYKQPHFFILNKGNNSGRPRKEPWTNCFVFVAENQQDHDFHFFVFMGLWQLKSFHPVIGGSVVPFIRKTDLIEVSNKMIPLLKAKRNDYREVQATIEKIEMSRSALQQKLDLLLQLRKAYLYEHFKK